MVSWERHGGCYLFEYFLMILFLPFFQSILNDIFTQIFHILISGTFNWQILFLLNFIFHYLFCNRFTRLLWNCHNKRSRHLAKEQIVLIDPFSFLVPIFRFIGYWLDNPIKFVLLFSYHFFDACLRKEVYVADPFLCENPNFICWVKTSLIDL